MYLRHLLTKGQIYIVSLLEFILLLNPLGLNGSFLLTNLYQALQSNYQIQKNLPNHEHLKYIFVHFQLVTKECKLFIFTWTRLVFFQYKNVIKVFFIWRALILRSPQECTTKRQLLRFECPHCNNFMIPWLLSPLWVTTIKFTIKHCREKFSSVLSIR